MDTCSTFRLEKINTKTPSVAEPKNHSAVIVGHFVISWGGNGRGAGPIYVLDRLKREWRFVDVQRSSYEALRAMEMFLVDDMVYGMFIHRNNSWSISKLDTVLLDELTDVFECPTPPMAYSSSAAFLEPLRDVVLFPRSSEGVWLWSLDSRSYLQLKVKGKPPERDGMGACCSYKNRVFFVGGQHGGIGLRVLDVTRTGAQWSKPRLARDSFKPTSRYRLTVTCSGPNRIFAFGGNLAKKDLVMFSFKEMRWFSIVNNWVLHNDALPLYGPTLSGNAGHAAVQTKDFLMVLGGYWEGTSLSTVLEIRPES